MAVAIPTIAYAAPDIDVERARTKRLLDLDRAYYSFVAANNHLCEYPNRRLHVQVLAQ